MTLGRVAFEAEFEEFSGQALSGASRGLPLQATLQWEFESSRLIASSCVKPLGDLKLLLEDVHRFVQAEQERGFLKSLLHRESRVAGIEGFYRRIGTTVNAFQISALLSIQQMLHSDKTARRQDIALNAHFIALENNHTELRRALAINQKNIMAMMVSIERRLDSPHSSDTDCQEIRPGMIEPVKPKLTLAQSEIMDGDIICFQVELPDLELRSLEGQGLSSNPVDSYRRFVAK